MHIPAMATCQQCGRTLPVRAQMQVQGASLPMLVVLSQVDSVEAALEQATCQVCLKKSGPTDRGLYEVLKRLGLKDEEDVSTSPREAAVVVRVREGHAAPTMGVAISDARPREVVMVDPLMGTSIQVTRQELHARGRRPHGQRRGARRPAQSEPRVPRALRVPERREPPAPIEHLTGAIGKSGDNTAVLEVAMKRAKVRDESKRLERAAAFDKLMFWLRLTLAKIRKNAATVEVWDFVETFERKLGEAASLDPHQHGRKRLLAELGNSAERLEALCHKFYQSNKLLQPRRPIEIVTMDAFEGGRRPESWDLKGGKKPAFYEFKVIRTRNSLPVPNPPLPNGDEDPRPRIVYPDGGGYGPDYTVEHSRHLAGVEGKIDQILDEVVRAFQRWLLANKEELTKLDDDDKPRAFHLGSFLRVFCEDLWEELAAEEAAGQVFNDSLTESIAAISPELSANT